MNRKELKQVLKPLIKECIKECIFEEGVLSGLISEVAKGISSNNMIVESPTRPNLDKEAYSVKIDATRKQKETEELLERDRQMRIKRLNESMKTKLNDVSIFENTIPAAPAISEERGHSPLSGVAPDDPGVDITGIMNLAGDGWKRMI